MKYMEILARRTEFGRRIEGSTGIPDKSQVRRYLQQPPTRPCGVDIPKEADGFLGHAKRAPEVGLEHVACIGLVGDLYLSDARESRIVDDDVDATEDCSRRSERGRHLFLVGDVELEDEEAVAGVFAGEVVQRGRRAGRCDDDIFAVL